MFLINTTLFILCVSNSNESEIILPTNSGLVRGKLVDDITLYYSFTGIPYAEPPIGNLRFRAPVPKSPWEGILDATEFGPVCVQPAKDYKKDEMSEDCLFLNVYVPAHGAGPFPVFVQVNGGAFRHGSGAENGPQLLLQRGVVVVTMNFRLGSIGYLCLDIDEASGNAGIKDVIMSFKWVKENIANFNGDPNNITVFGTSTGSVMVNYMLMSNQTANLFQRVVLISGSTLSFRSLALHPKDTAFALGESLRLNTTSTRVLLQQLLEIDAFTLIEAETNMGKNDTRKGYRTYAPFVPCIEIDSEHAVITEHPIETMKRGTYVDVTKLVTVSDRDGMLTIPTILKNPTLLDNLNEDLELCIPTNIEYPYGSNESVQIANSIRHLYFNDSNIPKNSYDELIKLISDTQYFYPINEMVKLMSEQNYHKELYYGYFIFDGELNAGKLKEKLNLPGADHGDILGYMFVTEVTRDKLKVLDSRSMRMLDIMLTAITNFIKFGNPTPVEYMDNDEEWEDYSKSNKYLILDEKPRLSLGKPGSEQLPFWYKTYDEYYKYKDNGGELEKKIIP